MNATLIFNKRRELFHQTLYLFKVSSQNDVYNDFEITEIDEHERLQRMNKKIKLIFSFPETHVDYSVIQKI